MQLVVKSEKIECDLIKELETAQVVVSPEINLSEGDNVSKILAICPTPRIVKIECGDGVAKIYGNIMWRVIYCLTDNTVMSGEYVTEYSDDIYSEYITPTAKLMAKSRVIDTDSSISGGKLDIEGVVEISSFLCITNEIECVTGAENCFSKQIDCEVSVMNSHVHDKINVSEDCDISGRADKILSFCTTPVIKDAIAMNDCVKIEGEILCDIVFMRENGADNKCFAIQFSSEIKAVGATQNDKIFFDCTVESAKLLIAYENNRTALRADVNLNVVICAFGKKYFTTLCDMYSPNFDIDIDRGELDCAELICNKYFEEKIIGTAQLDSNMPSAQTIIASVVNGNAISNIVAEEDVAIIEGMLSATVIYQDYDNNINSVSVELPYSIKKSVPGLRKGDMLLGSVVNGCACGRVKRDNELEINCELRITLHVFKNCMVKCITSAKQGEENATCKKAISIYFARAGETFWDIGKALSASVETIRGLNPNLTEPLKNNERVSIFRKLNMDESII